MLDNDATRQELLRDKKLTKRAWQCALDGLPVSNYIPAIHENGRLLRRKWIIAHDPGLGWPPKKLKPKHIFPAWFMVLIRIFAEWLDPHRERRIPILPDWFIS